MKIITSGSSYLDIDGYACCIAYAELLNLQEIPARAISSAPFNYSVSKGILSLCRKIEAPKSIFFELGTEFIIMDVSEPRFFEPFAKDGIIVEIYDHHVGFEEYWKKKLGDKAHIEIIGCAATLVFEEWEKAGLTSQMSPDTAKIMVAAILDNTLNFSASITNYRDIAAKEKLSVIADIDQEWCDSYFIECQDAVENNLFTSISKDAKTDCNITGLPKTIGQIAIWDAKKFMDRSDDIILTLDTLSSDWMLNVISIKDGKGYIICNNKKQRTRLQSIFNVSFDGNIAIMEKAMLRKEIIKKAIDSNI